ncbi:hypothetical protein [Parapedobacter indicus]|nr:hypothetical protein [Parapedobacter indicus]
MNKYQNEGNRSDRFCNAIQNSTFLLVDQQFHRGHFDRFRLHG